MLIESSDLPIEVNGVEVELPTRVSVPVDTHDIDWEGDLPPDSDVAQVTGKGTEGYDADDKANWLSDAIEIYVRQQLDEPPSGEEAYAEMEKYLRDKYTLNEWADLLDSNPTLVRLIQNEAYQDAVDRADYLAGQDSSLVDQEDADKLREVTKV